MSDSDKSVSRYGIGEWYGKNIANISSDERSRLAKVKKNKSQPCPFKGIDTMCNKTDGVCTLANYERNANSTSCNNVSVNTNNLVTTCPNRFWQKNLIFYEISKDLLKTEKPKLIPEVGFLQGKDAKGNTLPSTVGRLDLIVANIAPDNSIIDWCALEMQAVYFSGASMKKDINKIYDQHGGITFPTGIRRPDFRSSGPKRLMPQLQIKVPTLRRWGKKMVVVIDYSFFNSMAPMEREQDISNADILWLIVNYDNKNTLYIEDKVYTTLESSVTGLTAGVPIPLDNFEEKILKTIQDGSKIISF
ncbi:MAG: NotI family restriction endonuclease [Balneolales bacterium]